MSLRACRLWIIRRPRIALSLLLCLQASLLTWNAVENSPVVDEIGHFPAGLSHWRFGKFDLYRVNPPLVRSVAAIPVLFSDCREEWALYRSESLAREEVPVGRSFVSVNGRRIFHYVTLSRLAVIPFSLLGAVVCYCWTYSLSGRCGALFAAGLYVTSPNLLAHGALITPDAGASALGLLAAFTYAKWLREATWKNAIIAGTALGFAELTKTTWLVLFCLWPLILLLAICFRKTGNRSENSLPRQLLQLFLMLALGLYVLNLGRLFRVAFCVTTRFHTYKLPGVTRRRSTGADWLTCTSMEEIGAAQWSTRIVPSGGYRKPQILR